MHSNYFREEHVLRKINIIILFICILFFLTCNNEPPKINSQIQNKSKLSILTIDEPPTNFIDEDGKIAGLAVEIVKLIQKRLGTDERIELYSTPKVLKKSLTKPNVILFTLARTPERENKYYWITQVAVKNWVFITRKDSKRKIKNLNDAKLVKYIGVAKGGVREAYLKKNGFENIVPLSSHELIVKNCIKGKIPLILYSRFGIAAICKRSKQNCKYNDFKFHFSPSHSNSYIAISKNGTDLKIVKQWQKAAAEIKKDGSLIKILLKWQIYIKNNYGMQSIIRKNKLIL